MIRDQQLSPEQNEEFSGQIMQSLRERIALSERDEILDYLNVLIPKYEMPPNQAAPVASHRQMYDWSEFLDFYGEDFIRNAYLCIVKREADVAALESAAHSLDADECSRIIFLGRLRYSEEGCGHATKITGLWARYRYQLARMEGKPLRRRMYALLIKLGKLFRPRLEAALVSQRREIAECNREISRLEARFMQHYNDTLKHVKREIAEALTADITQ